MNKPLTPSRITYARVELKLSQTDLAEISGVSRVTISKIENGVLLHPSFETISALSWALKKPISFFYPSGELTLKPSTIPSYRGMKTRSKTDVLRTQFKIDDCMLLIQYLFSLIKPRTTNLQFYDSDSITDLSPEDVEGIAAYTRQQFKLGQGCIKPLTVLFENNGIICMPADLPEKIDSVNISIPMGEGKETVLILYKQSLNYYRQRFSLAHELGHVMLHHYVDEDEYVEHYDEFEKQANKFASSFLMPKEAFYSTIRDVSLNGTLKLKNIWDVSAAAIIWRMYDISVIDKKRYEYFQIQMAKKKWKTCEPGDKQASPEYPYYMRNAFDFILRNGISTVENILEYTGLSPKEIVNYIDNVNWFMPVKARNEFQIQMK